MGTIAPYLAIGASLVGAAGQIHQGNSAAAQSNYLAQVARNQQQMHQRNALVHEQSAQSAEQQGASDRQRQQIKTAQVIGAHRAGLAAQGGDINTGSNLDLIGDQARSGAFDALSIDHNAAQKAYQLRLQAMNSSNLSNLAGADSANEHRRAIDTGTSTAFGVGKSLLGDASSIIPKHWKWSS